MPTVARDVMTRNVVTVTPATSLVELERLLISRRIGGTPVKEQHRLVGMVSRSDIIRVLSYEQSLAEVQSGAFRNELGITDRRALELISGHVGERMQTLKVRDAMTPVRAQVGPDAPLQEIADLMVKGRVHRVLVMEDQILRGIVARSDLIMLVASGQLREPLAPEAQLPLHASDAQPVAADAPHDA